MHGRMRELTRPNRSTNLFSIKWVDFRFRIQKNR